MEELEKVEKLRESAGVSYEEAREALRASNGDLLDAIVYLEKQGKMTRPAPSVYSTEYEEQNGYERVEDHFEKEPTGRGFFERLKHFMSVIWRTLVDNSVSMKDKNGQEILKVPLILLVVLIFAGFGAIIPVMIVLLFFGFRYNIVGEKDMPNVNEILNRAGDMADNMKSELK
ncbi:MAG: hypothetical protein K5770_08805 [Lachnospiraceae bacterium]|nr:hypothetical protein [Lachnospiraceae bacterium]